MITVIEIISLECVEIEREKLSLVDCISKHALVCIGGTQRSRV